jgi:uncharacterized membrane protein
MPSRNAVRRWGTAAFGAVVVLGIALRLYNPSGLWLDETLSVNISRLPLSELFDALRQDGSPPLYYVLLHGWMALFGEGDAAVREISCMFGIAALPVAYLVGRRIHGPTAGRAAVVVLAMNPFLVRYSTEARMYALVVLLTLLAILATQRAAERPVPSRLGAVTLLSGLLALTHYWSLFFLAVVAAFLLCISLRGPYQNTARRLLAAIVLSALLFAPWIDSFLFQLRHTGTPWADPPGLAVLVDTARNWAGGVSWPATVLVLLMIAATGAALWPAPGARSQRWIRLRAVPNGPFAVGLFVCAYGGLLLAVVASRAVSAGFAVRYTAAMVGPALVLVGIGVNRLRAPLRSALLVSITLLGLAGSAALPFADDRTQARRTAAVLAAGVQPDDLIVYCPDQLGPAVSRLLPNSIEQVLYPSLAAPQLVDWVDYASRNAAASPVTIGARISAMSDGHIWLVSAPNYRTFGNQCAQLDSVLAELRGGRHPVQARDTAFFEQQAVVEYPSTVQ